MSGGMYERREIFQKRVRNVRGKQHIYLAFIEPTKLFPILSLPKKD